MAKLLISDKAATSLGYNIYTYSLPTGALPAAPAASQTYSGTVHGLSIAGCQDTIGNSYFLLNSSGSSGAYGVLKISSGGVQSFYVTLAGVAALGPALGSGASLAVDASGNVYVFGNPGEVWKFTPSGVKSVFASSVDIGFGYALAFDYLGNLVVAGFNLSSGHTTLVSVNTSGTAATLNGNILAGLGSPGTGSNICFDSDGNIYVLALLGFAGSQLAQFSARGVELNAAFINLGVGVFAGYQEYHHAYDSGSNTFFVSTSTSGFGAFCMAFSNLGVVLSPASLIGTKSGPYNVTGASNKLKIAMNGAAPVTVTLTTGAARTAAQVVTEINTALGSAVASVVSGKIFLASSTAGNTSQINLQSIASSAYSVLGLVYPPVPGGNISTPDLTGPTQFFFNGVGSLALAGPPPPLYVPPFSGEAWLVIDEPGVGVTDRSGYLYKSSGVQHSWTQEIRQRGQATFDLRIPAGDTYSPTRSTQMFLYDQTAAGYTRAFAGIIQDIEDTWLDNSGERRVLITAMSMESVFDTVYADPVQYVDKTCGFIFTDIFNRYESGCPVTLGVVSAGETIPLFNTKKGDRISDLFTQLATTSLFTWGVNPVDLKLNFRNPSSAPAPFTLSSGDILWETASWKVRGADFRNHQGTRVSFDAFPHSMEYITVTSSQQAFTLRNPANQVVKCYVTLSTPNSATGTFSGQPTPGDTVTVGPLAAAWIANHAYALGGQIVVGGFVQEVTSAGTTGASQPVFGTATGDTTADFTVVWTCRGPSGFSTGTYTYTFVAVLDNTQFGQVIIGANVAATCRNLANAINADAPSRRLTVSLPTWENSQCNAINITPTAFTIQQKAAGTSYIAALSATGIAFSWSSPYTTGGTSPQGSVGPGEGATASYGVYASGTSSAPNSLIYTPGSTDILLSTPLPVTPVGLNIEYTRVDGDTVEVEDSALVAATAALTGGTGLYEAFSDQSSTGLISTSAAAALQLVQQGLLAFKVPPANFKFDTMRPGLRAGMTLAALIAKPTGASALLNGSWVIESLDVSLIEPAKVPYLTDDLGHYKYTVSCVNVNQIGSWTDFWNGQGGGGGSSSLVATSGGALNVAGSSTFPQDFSNQTISGQSFTAGDGASFDLASFLNCTAVGCAFTGRFFGAIFKNAGLQNSTFTGDFEACDFSNTSLDNCTFSGRFLNCIFSASNAAAPVTATDCDFTGSSFRVATLLGDYSNSIFTSCGMRDATINNCTMQGTIWNGTPFEDSVLSATDFSDAGGRPSNFMACSFRFNELDGTNFTGANMSGASFYLTGGGAPPVFDGCNVTGTRFNDMNSGPLELVKYITVSYAAKSWDANKVISATGAGIVVSLPDPATSDTWEVIVQNADPSNGVDVDPGGLSINGSGGPVTVAPGSALRIFCDGTNYAAF